MTALCSWPVYALAFALGLSGCAATTTAVGKRKLDVQTKMTDSIFLEPVTTANKSWSRCATAPIAPIWMSRPRFGRRSGRAAIDSSTTRSRRVFCSRAAAEGAFAKGFGSALIGGAGGAGLGRVASDRPRR
jgi:hypothetical protein